jgi:hypothetical protein
MGLGKVQDDRLDRVLAETLERPDPLEAVDHQEPIGGLRLGHHDDRDLLARFADRAQ